MRKLLFTICVGIIGCMTAYPEGGSCTMDVQKFCGGVQPGEGRIQKCLKSHKDELSENCKTKDEKDSRVGLTHRRRHHKRKTKNQ